MARWDKEQLQDNSKVVSCRQCEDCRHRDDGTVWANDYQKSSCALYPYPEMKPFDVMGNTGICPFHEAEDSK